MRAPPPRSLGSPPRMRGEDGRCRSWGHICRITPAHAGRSSYGAACRLALWDHPRACGEKKLHSLPALRRLGSPPRMRGEVFYENQLGGQLGITPAHAGRSLKALK